MPVVAGAAGLHATLLIVIFHREDLKNGANDGS
jgi:hypothetical protein